MNEEQIINKGQDVIREKVKCIVEELDEIIDFDREQSELDQMFMDENETL
jgi:hypothetical protein